MRCVQLHLLAAAASVPVPVAVAVAVPVAVPVAVAVAVAVPRICQQQPPQQPGRQVSTGSNMFASHMCTTYATISHMCVVSTGSNMFASHM